jgi:cobalt-zinc-cadmium efflux system membrane fusion protein
LQYNEGQPLVFIETDGGFAARPVRLGLQDRAHAEVLDGLRAGERVVIANSFLLKSEWLKGEGGSDD